MISPDSNTAVRSFLDGQFATVDSLELLPELLQEEERTHKLLEDELQQAKRTTASLSTESRAIIANARSRASDLLSIRNTLVTDTDSLRHFGDESEAMALVSVLADDLRAYRKLTQAKAYVDAVVEIETVRDRATRAIPANMQGAMAAFQQSIEILGRRSDGTQIPKHLLEHLKATVRGIWHDIDKAASDSQSEAMRKFGWPGKMNAAGSALATFSAAFSNLLTLDRITSESASILSTLNLELRANSSAPLPLEHMASAIDIRMRYHFEGSRQTNRAEKPEWWLSQLLVMLRNTVPFLETRVQQLYDGVSMTRLDVRNELIRLVTPAVQRKLTLDRQAYLDNGLIIAHVVSELRDFDTTLRDVYFYDGPSVLNEFTSDKDVFGAWIEDERTNASDSYMEAIRDPIAFELAYDDEMFGPEDAKPSHVSERVVQLVETITERYSVLPSCMQHLQMLATTQFPIVIAFVEDIEAEIDEFNRISLAFMRDNTETDRTQSPLFAQLRRLAAWYQAVWYVEEAADEWNNSAVFVDMWAAVCRHATLQNSRADPRDWRESADTWGEEDREILDAVDDGEWTDNDDWLDGGIWERSIATLRELRQRIGDLMSRAVNKEAVTQLRAYSKANSWTPDIDDDLAVSDLSPELSNFLLELSAAITYLKTLVPAAARIRIISSLTEELDGFLVQKVATAHPFSALGGHRFLKDVNAISHILAPAHSSTVPAALLRSRTLVKAKECALVLACDLSATDSSPAGESTMPVPLEEWGPIIRDSSSDKMEVGMMLKKLGIKHLSFTEVQQLVNRRSDFSRLQGSP